MKYEMMKKYVNDEMIYNYDILLYILNDCWQGELVEQFSLDCWSASPKSR